MSGTCHTPIPVIPVVVIVPTPFSYPRFLLPVTCPRYPLPTSFSCRRFAGADFTYHFPAVASQVPASHIIFLPSFLRCRLHISFSCRRFPDSRFPHRFPAVASQVPASHIVFLLLDSRYLLPVFNSSAPLYRTPQTPHNPVPSAVLSGISYFYSCGPPVPVYHRSASPGPLR